MRCTTQVCLAAASTRSSSPSDRLDPDPEAPREDLLVSLARFA
jgi:hypothetical protein